ncbi:uncharacterized protein LOC111051013 isoform X5 [Nilaparvata lugens]|uniref:uncharacterized protein LOC111051013 isoform X5 n=1 Tax=Nilaparvata lugens TaxID=108931 RepID=UPI00193D480A|nr:uncharacterized protein LOC111051013 isoform X5 [Nilaparvata lugens]
MDENKDTAGNKTDEELECEKKLINLFRHPSLRDDLISLFIVKMFESVVKSWEGYPCVEKLKANPPNKGSEKISTEFVPLSDAKVNDEKWEKNDSVTEQSTKQEILQKYLDVKMSSLVEQELRNRHFSVESMIPELTWITEANGDMNQPIDDWKRYKDDQIAKIEFRNGNVYKGRVSRHVMHGEGEFIWLDGTSYKGSFDTGHITGNGVVTWPTQSWYKGELVKGYRQGNGLLVVPGRLAFAGSWANGVRYGPGLLLQDSEPTRGYCDTTWRRDVCHGLGTRVYPSGAVFHGHWQDGKRHGFGVINWPNGDMYRGDWKNDRMHGLGEFTWSLGAATSHKSSISFQNRYYGTWVDGSRHENNHFALLKDHRNPFERLSFFQFLHYLIEISWHLYGKYGERQLKTPGALASALEKFIVADLKQSIGNNSGSVFKDSRNLCFMREIFGLYQSLQSDLTARQLLNAILNWKNNSYLKNVQEMSHDIIKQFDGRDTYAKIKICANQSLENLKKVKSEPAKIMYLAYLDYVNPRIAMKCILQICPRVKTSDRFYNMDYKMTFLELYEILLLCAVECFEFKKKQERRKQAIEIKLSQKPKEERRTSLKKTRVSRDNSAKALKISKKP